MQRLPHLLARLVCAVLITAPLVAGAATENFSYTGLNASIPDGDPSGLANVQSITSSITQIQSVVVGVSISGSFNGDLYAYLEHDSGFAVLLNRTGRTSTNSFGYADSGFNVTLSDSAANDIHLYQTFATPPAGTALMGPWQPDGRNFDPDQVLDSSPRNALLNDFIGGNPNGTWTLFVADLSDGATQTLESWSLQITGVPEPTTGALASAGVLLFARRLRRRA